MRLLITGADINENSPLHLSMLKENMNFFKPLISEEVDVTAGDRLEKTRLL